MRPLRSTFEKPNASARSRRGASTRRHALDRLDLRLRLARARARAELVHEALQPGDLGLLALEGVGLVRERERLLAAVGAVAHRVVLAAPELELEHAGGDALQEPAVVRDEQDRAGQRRQLVLEPFERAQVEVVRGLVEQQQVGLRREHARERRARQLAARERAERPVGVLDPEAQSAQDLLEARAPGVAAHRFELGLRVRVGAQHVVAAVALRHAALELAQPVLGGVHVGQALADVGAEGMCARNRRPLVVQRDAVALGLADVARVGVDLADDGAQERRLARSVAADQGQALARRQPEGHAVVDDVAPKLLRRPVTCRVGTPRGYPGRVLPLGAGECAPRSAA